MLLCVVNFGGVDTRTNALPNAAILTSIIGGDSMKKSLIRWSLVVILALLAVIGGPIIINECYYCQLNVACKKQRKAYTNWQVKCSVLRLDGAVR